MEDTIKLKDFLDWAKNRWWDNPQIDIAIEDLKNKWITVEWWDNFKNTVTQKESTTQPQKNDWTLWQAAIATAILWSPAAAIWTRKLIKNMIWPNEKEIGDAIWWIKKYLVWAGWWMKPEALDETAKNIVKMLQNIPKEAGKIDSRTLYNYAQSIKDNAFLSKTEELTKAWDRFITESALDPIKKEIVNLEKVWAPKSKINWLKSFLKDVQSRFVDWKMSVADAEEIKKYHAWEYKWYKQWAKIWASPEANIAWLWHGKLAEWFRKEIDAVVPELRPHNTTYWAAKDVEAGIAKFSNKVAQQPQSTPFRILKTKAGKTIQEIPWIATAGKALNPLPTEVFEERKIPQYIKMAQKYGDEMLSYIEKNAEKWKSILDKIEDVKNSKFVQKASNILSKVKWPIKTLWKVATVASVLWAGSELLWLDNSVQAWWSDRQKTIQEKTTPKYWKWWTLTEWKSWFINPEPQLFKWSQIAQKDYQATTYSLPIIWQAVWWIDLLSQWLSAWERFIRSRINKSKAKKK